MRQLCILILFTTAIAHGQYKFIDLDSNTNVPFKGLFKAYPIIAIGEVHGTTEVPLLVLNMAKEALEVTDSLTVALEISSSFQKDINAFLKHGQMSRLKTLGHFQYPDGRSSEAMILLLSGLRNLNKVKVLCFDLDWNTVHRKKRDSLMGINLSQAYDGNPMLILTGNLHATIDLESMRPGVKSAVYHFKELSGVGNKLLALNTYFDGGTAWTCQKEGCKTYPAGKTTVLNNNGLKNFIRYDTSKIDNGYHGFVFFDKVSASLPTGTSLLELNKVVETFKTAIIRKDSISFKSLFFKENVPFVGIMSEATEGSIKKDYPDFQGLSVSSSNKFISEICATTKPQEEKFYNTSIKTDGMIASIGFDYSYHSGDRIMQWGHEKWNLVFAEKQWLITDVVYSIHFPDVEPVPNFK